MLPLLEALLQASSKVKSFQVIDNDPIDEERDLPNFPHHYHDPQGNVTESLLTGDPTVDLPQVLNAL